MAWNIADTTYYNKQSIKIFFLFLFQHILLARCKGFCNKSKTEPRVTFSPVLYRPFNYHCKCCRDSLSIMKAVRLTCEGNKTVFATYRYILRCKCRNCNFRRWWFVFWPIKTLVAFRWSWKKTEVDGFVTSRNIHWYSYWSNWTSAQVPSVPMNKLDALCYTLWSENSFLKINHWTYGKPPRYNILLQYPKTIYTHICEIAFCFCFTCIYV